MSMLVCSTNDSGSAPNFSWSARLRALSRVKPPVMLARPSRIASLKRGATMTCESRVAASWFCGSGSATILRLMSAYCLAPSPLSVSAISTSLVTLPCWLLW